LITHDLLTGWRIAFVFAASIVFGALMLRAMFALAHSRLHDDWVKIFGGAARATWLLPLAWLPLMHGGGSVLRGIAYFGLLLIAGTRRVPEAAGLIALVFAGSAAACDWLAQHSAVFGLRWCVNGLLGAAALAVVLVDSDLRARVDGANLLFALSLGWLYLLFCDEITAWSGNLPEEIAPYQTGVTAMTILAVVHAAVAAILLVRRVKRSRTLLAAIAAVLLIAQWFEACVSLQAKPLGIAFAAAITVAVGMGFWLRRWRTAHA